jgi:hypothetical protein
MPLIKSQASAFSGRHNHQLLGQFAEDGAIDVVA